MMGQLTKQFGKIKVEVEIPHLLNLQVDSYRKFMQEGRTERLPDEGLEGVFRSVFPIEDFNRTASLEFVSYEVGEPKYDQAECISKGLTYESPVRIKVRLVVYDVDDETEARTVRDIKEQDIYFGTLPLMTEKGTFIINGTERVIVNQLQRSPGIIFEHDGGKTHTSPKVLYSCRVIPMRGSWLDFDFDHKDILYVRIDRRRKMPATILLKAMGMSKTEILDCFYKKEIYELEDDGRASWHFNPELHRKEAAFADIVDKEGNVLVKAGKPITKRAWRQMEAAGVEKIEVAPETPLGLFLAEDLVDNATGEILAEAADEITAGLFDACREAGITTISALHTRGTDTSSSIRDTLVQDKTPTMEKAQEEIYRRLRPSSPPTPEIAASFFDNLFRNGDYYDLSPVGRYKLNQRLNKTDHADLRTLADDDILDAIKVLVQLKDSHGPADDIDHLGNRRVRLVGELVENQYRIGLVRMERAIKERMSIQEVATLMPHDLINPKPVAAVLKEFFGTSQLSQFMDQTNPLAEITHKRRMSALGPGGLSRERAGFEVRDVHYTHYGRLCPIETPEGPNIGLISSLCVFAKINELGFIETPYRKVENGKVDLSDNGLIYLTAEEEEEKVIAQGNAPLNDDGTFVLNRVKSRQDADFPVVEPSEVDLMDVAPQQIASIAASLIPFLEHDDANRALMGSNMMRQAVPLLRSEAPIVGTGIERQLVRDSRTQITAEGDGVVDYVDATTIRILYDRTEDEEFVSFEPALKEYRIPKFRKTNQNMTIDLRPICDKGQRVKKGDILTEGYSTEKGELALGKNLLVAYMPWKGYNYEDAIVLNERVVREDLLTSVHVEEYSLEVRETKRGMEELTSDIPNVSEEATKDLDENGIVRIGARIEPGDIMIGKITPKGESDPSPEEKLLRAIFGDKAGDVKDASLKASPSLKGVVIDKKLFSRVIKNRSSKLADKALLPKIDDEFESKVADLKRILVKKLMTLTEGKVSQGVKDYLGAEVIAKGSKFSASDFDSLDFTSIQLSNWTSDDHINGMIRDLVMNFIKKYKELDAELKRKKFAITIGDELPAGIIQMAKVYIAKKRKIGVGDKMAGRHGNKGIVSRVVRQEDMPFLADGTPVDIVLNPLGVPSRMNIGQIFEAVLGRAGKTLGVKFATPIFDGATMEDLDQWTDKAGLPRYCKTYLCDGGTGEQFDQAATVGVTYMLKLGHMVEDKMHARSIGPYSLITQQPLGGKAQFGGQRFGEMEVWALEGFGAAHILQEILTIKSDDVVGRSKAYEAIVKGEPMPQPGIPESLNVLLHELRGLGLSINLE